MKYPLILASASPRRKKILTELGLDFEVAVPGVEETRFEGDPERTVRENSLIKHRWARSRYPENTILTADTIVVFGNRIIEKPKSMDEAVSFLRMFSGNVQKVLTAVAVSTPESEIDCRVIESIVHFLPLTNEMIDDYFRKVNPMDKAGGYDVDQYGDLVIDSYEGSHSNIMGLPRQTAAEMLGIN